MNVGDRVFQFFEYPVRLATVVAFEGELVRIRYDRGAAPKKGALPAAEERLLHPEHLRHVSNQTEAGRTAEEIRKLRWYAVRSHERSQRRIELLAADLDQVARELRHEASLRALALRLEEDTDV